MYFSTPSSNNVSKKRLAKIAMNAIMKELKKAAGHGKGAIQTIQKF